MRFDREILCPWDSIPGGDSRLLLAHSFLSSCKWGEWAVLSCYAILLLCNEFWLLCLPSCVASLQIQKTWDQPMICWNLPNSEQLFFPCLQADISDISIDWQKGDRHKSVSIFCLYFCGLSSKQFHIWSKIIWICTLKSMPLEFIAEFFELP